MSWQYTAILYREEYSPLVPSLLSESGRSCLKAADGHTLAALKSLNNGHFC